MLHRDSLLRHGPVSAAPPMKQSSGHHNGRYNMPYNPLRRSIHPQSAIHILILLPSSDNGPQSADDVRHLYNPPAFRLPLTSLGYPFDRRSRGPPSSPRIYTSNPPPGPYRGPSALASPAYSSQPYNSYGLRQPPCQLHGPHRDAQPE